MRRRIATWLSERYPVESIREFLKQQSGKLLPPHVSWAHTLGSLLLYLTLNQIVTGILLMVYYRPAPETAFESIHHIMTRTHFGWLIRGLHAWGANVMILLLVAHMFRTFLMGSFKKPRELTWITGVFILGTVLTFGFTGYLLPWNQVSYWATTVGTEIAGAIPLVGEPLKVLLRGGDAVSGETLSRFYAMHVAVLPWLLVFLVGVHLLLVRLHGLAPLDPVGRETPLSEKKGLRFFPEHVAKEGVVFSVFLAVLVAIVFLFPPELGEKADAFRSPEGVKPEWYFLPTYQLLKYLPKLLGIFVSVVPLALLLLWPFLDRSPERHPRKRPWSAAIGVAALLLALVFGALGFLSESAVQILGKQVRFDFYGVPRLQPTAPEEAPVPPEKRPQISLKVDTEEGKKMLIATVAQQGRPLEKIKLAFFAESESEWKPIGQDETLDDGTAAVRFPEGMPGGPKGELRFRAEVKEPPSFAGAQAEGQFLGGIPVSSCPWKPASLGTLVVVGATVLAGLFSAFAFYLLTRHRGKIP